jgi:hypothetical protein
MSLFGREVGAADRQFARVSARDDAGDAVEVGVVAEDLRDFRHPA